MDKNCNCFLKYFFLIRFSISLITFLIFNCFKITPFVIVSGNPPLLLIMTAHPFDEASRLVLPKGSSHLEQTTAILDFLYIFKTSLCFMNPNFTKFL